MKFQHYKGGIYELITYATHTETNEKLVIYSDEYNNVYARPYNMFFENVIVDGKEIPRFKKL
ncbi:DUF1653 domain-containing protein [Bacillus atrophaeus]|uniref:DUF1653 domain-containing protein n=1 Tax=Bacillus atrophaeus TaxID=1452 RepID=UPI002280CC23|nr:DUF1653 domain-containing protein [Bacillus atrophaeus]MCY9204340.1 DUF1653 domain-containing protein [Bacillus atrophaeus]MEC0885282.1 DUF1653 domain-containing protein [Bacillus atrophaeus]